MRADFKSEPGGNFSRLAKKKKVFRMSVSKTGKSPSFSPIHISFPSVDGVRK